MSVIESTSTSVEAGKKVINISGSPFESITGFANDDDNREKSVDGEFWILFDFVNSFAQETKQEAKRRS